MLETLTRLDQQFCYQSEAPGDGGWFQVTRGEVPVIVSAPHACMHSRDGESKMQEEYTGAIALYLAECCGCHAIVTCCQTNEDPNWQPDSSYKAAIKKIAGKYNPRFLIDLHGMRNRYHMGAALGTIKGSSCDPELVLPHFQRAGFMHTVADTLVPDEHNAWRNVVVDHPKFTGGLINHTVTRFASQQLGIPSVQIELSSEARVVESAPSEDWPFDYRGNPEAIHSSVTALQNLVAAFA